jgi:sugar transferase EpsL
VRRGALYRRFGKRVFDLAVSVPALVVLSPLFATIAALVRLRLGRPILFRQARGGLCCEPFDVIKFRTMSDARGPEGELLPDHDRLPLLGRALRAVSLDELPELLNVVRGEMSLVGPRPFIYDYMPHYSAEQRRRHDVRPGITGLAQVEGRNQLTWEQRFAYDLQYVDNVSFAVDLRILWLTVLAVGRRRGINEGESLTSQRFDERLGEG